MMQYKEIEPGESLREFVDCFWYINFRNNEQKNSPVQRCLPVGMVELIIHTRGQLAFSLNKEVPENYPSAFLVGIMTRPAVWAMPPDCEMFGVRMKPEAAIRLFNQPLSSFFNDFTDADDFMGEKHSPILDMIRNAGNLNDRIFLMESFIHNRIAASYALQNYFTESLRMIRSGGTDLSIDELSNKVYVGERQLQRCFKSMLGLSPKHYQRIIRFRHAFLLAQHEQINWTDISYQMGYSDQSHFIRDFREFSGEAPARLFA